MLFDPSKLVGEWPEASEADAYRRGWADCLAGEDGRYTNHYPRNGSARHAYDSGFLDAMDAEAGEQPDPQAAGYGE